MRTRLPSLVSTIIVAALACGGERRYPLNIRRNLGMASSIRAALDEVDRDRPAMWSVDNDAFLAYVFQNGLTGGMPAKLPRLLADRFTTVWSRQWRRVLGGTHSVSYRSRYRGQPVIHEVTAGVIDMPLGLVRSRWYLPREWGRNLAAYVGGELAVDVRDSRGRTTLQRERMVLATPWYALGAPDLDMSKYELVDYQRERVTISWIVTKSENRSVLVDVGYLELRALNAAGREQTLVLFNSVHRIDPGWFGWLAPGLVETNVRQTFIDHIERYRRALRPQVALADS